MKRCFSVLVVVFAVGLAGLSGWGCEEEPKCREACLHACEICGQECDPSVPAVLDGLEACEEMCTTGENSVGRVECVLKTLSCDELWKC